mgnify:CR=1 FL=1
MSFKDVKLGTYDTVPHTWLVNLYECYKVTDTEIVAFVEIQKKRRDWGKLKTLISFFFLRRSKD